MADNNLLIGEMHGIIKGWEKNGFPQCSIHKEKVGKLEGSVTWIKGVIWAGVIFLATLRIPTLF